MTDLPGGLLGGAANLVGGVLGGAGDLVGGVLGGATQVLAKTGDTLGSIADAHGVSLSSVVEANPQVLHPDLVQPGQAISIPQPGPPASPEAGQPPAAPPPGGGLVEGLGQTVAQTANAAGSLLGRTIGAAGAPAGRTVEAVGVAANPAPAQGTGPGEASPPTALPQAPVSVVVGQGSADFRVLAQAAPPLAPIQAAAPGAPTLMQALAGIDPALAQLLAGALASPTLSTPATPAQLAKLEAALLSLGWAAVSLGLAKPGDVVLLLRTAMLQAARAPAEGLAFSGADNGDAPAGTPSTRAYAPPSGSPSGVDSAGPQRLRGRAPGDTESEASGAGADREREREPAGSPQRAWIARALPTAIAVKARWGVPVAVTIAVGALASDWGRVAPANDYFGLGERRSGRVALPPPEARVPALRGAAPVTSAFEDVDDAAQAFGAFVSETPAFARAFRAPDAKAFARRLGEAGFSRDPAHGERLAELIDTYALTALDG